MARASSLTQHTLTILPALHQFKENPTTPHQGPSWYTTFPKRQAKIAPVLPQPCKEKKNKHLAPLENTAQEHVTERRNLAFEEMIMCIPVPA